MGVARGFVTGVLVLCALAAAAPAGAQVRVAGSVLEVIDGDTIDVAADDGTRVRVRLIGVDAPEVGECGFAEATRLLEPYEGHRVTLTTDPTQDTFDRFNRLLAYADTDRAVDLGHTVIAFGRARIFVFANRPFQRLDAYRQAESAAAARDLGTWRTCDGDFHRRAGEAAETPRETREDTAERHVRRFYFLLNERRHRDAWSLLSLGLRSRLGPYPTWRAGYRRTLGTKVNAAEVTLTSGLAIVRVAIRARERDACSGRVVRQFFRTRWVLLRHGGRWIARSLSSRKVGGGRVRLSRSSCSAPKPRRQDAPAPSRPSPPARQPGGGCHPSYSPCVPTGRDYDCPELDGPYTVRGSDPYRLDGDGDGVGCE